MSNIFLKALGEKRGLSLKCAEKIHAHQELLNQSVQEDFLGIEKSATILEVAALDFAPHELTEDSENLKQMRECAADAFKLLKVLLLSNKLGFPRTPFNDSYFLLRMACLAVLGDRGVDIAKILKVHWGNPLQKPENWRERTWVVITDVWLRLIRKDGWVDRDKVLEGIADLREQQSKYEESYFESIEADYAKAAALELVGLYHLAKAGEVLAHFITDGSYEGNHQVKVVLETHFKKTLSVCQHARLAHLESMATLLRLTAMQLVDNSIWTVTRSVNTRVTQFVKTIVDRGRGDKAVFDVLPPQRRSLAEKNLLGSSHRAVVVSLPTSSGKTMIAQFRILQALNQFDLEKGWVAYLAPTRALVNQVTKQMRSDFEPLSIFVEKASPALEIDSNEVSLLQQRDGKQFRILVTTPEKLDLLLRQGWENKIGRPLALVVVDEAHNIQSMERGLRLELLLTTINHECKKAQFLLLTPFIENAREIARWLGETSHDDISLSLDWQPNDRIIGIAKPERGKKLSGNSYDYDIGFQTVHTSRKTITFDEPMKFPKQNSIAKTFSKAASKGKVATITACHLKKRGPVIVMHSRPDWVWSLADDLKKGLEKTKEIDKDIKLVQDYMKLELGNEFPMIELLEYGIGVHHAGLPEEARSLIEWVFSSGKLNFLVATTTIAHGINFPASSVVMASHQYFSSKGANDMPPEDFWNIAGRTGRVSQGQLGVVALAADNDQSANNLETFIKERVKNLNSALVHMVMEAEDLLDDLGKAVYRNPHWSPFLQYLVHTYLQMGDLQSAERIEHALRGTFGFKQLEAEKADLAEKLIAGVKAYYKKITKKGQPLKLVDSAGFCLESIKYVLKSKGSIDENSWKSGYLYSSEDKILEQMMGILLKVPELGENLSGIFQDGRQDGSKLSKMIKDWVNGASIDAMAGKYFQKQGKNEVDAITKCGQSLFGKIVMTTSWGLGALLAITGSKLDDQDRDKVSNLCSYAFYGVNSDEAVTLRLLGIPRSAAIPMAAKLQEHLSKPLPDLRETLRKFGEADWMLFAGEHGKIYRRVWRILEGFES